MGFSMYIKILLTGGKVKCILLYPFPMASPPVFLFLNSFMEHLQKYKDFAARIPMILWSFTKSL